MNLESFDQQRRQQFLYPELYINCRARQMKTVQFQRDQSIEYINDPEYGFGHMHHVTCHQFIYLETFWLWMLDYTAGGDLDELALRFAEVVDLFVEWFEVQKARNQLKLQKNPDIGIDPEAAAVDFYNQLEYQDTLQLVSIALLLRDQISILRIIDCLKFYRGEDVLLEQLILDYVPDPSDTDELFHYEPYHLLADLFFEDEEDEAEPISYLQQYLKEWYPHMEGARWYDAHRQIVDDNAPYYGYWAFEAGATACLLDLDDSQIDHMVYPKDLVAYAKKLRAEDRYTSKKGDAIKPTQYRVEAKQPCTRAGYWYTPAKQNSRTPFKQGDVMPDFPDSSYGATIWYWDQNQD
jgi:hypothetical protein